LRTKITLRSKKPKTSETFKKNLETPEEHKGKKKDIYI